ncbi:uncharacterized protein LOC129000289 [Macrosteles quadrilineatus]|uniref:uncharacterized protein LOC129000289 n=1 Tax=Macrosteles quadrilineatus TaxID=74068 RepID=UPI0023E16C35|nr:uncharacterized protein LOC129000289 [Macrosteles quadrilineatus]
MLVRVCASVCVAFIFLNVVRTESEDKSDKSFSEFKPKDVETGEYPDYDKYEDMPSDPSAEQTLWQKMMREPKTRRPTKPMTKTRARMMKRRAAYLKARAEREAEEARLEALYGTTTNEVITPSSDERKNFVTERPYGG